MTLGKSWRAFAVAFTMLACAPTPKAVAPGAATSEHTEPEPKPEPEPAPSSANPESKPEALVGIPACDEYLSAYQKCEPKLKPEIESGNRRTYEAEKNWLVFMKSQPQGQELESACKSMQAELDKSCP